MLQACQTASSSNDAVLNAQSNEEMMAGRAFHARIAEGKQRNGSGVAYRSFEDIDTDALVFALREKTRCRNSCADAAKCTRVMQQGLHSA